MNFYNLRTECRTILNLWKQRWLSLAGKVQTFKSLITSKSVYIATMKGIPQEVLDDLQSIHNEFIWDDRRAKIKHSTLIGNMKRVDSRMLIFNQNLHLVKQFGSGKW